MTEIVTFLTNIYESGESLSLRRAVATSFKEATLNSLLKSWKNIANDEKVVQQGVHSFFSTILLDQQTSE